jgi:hypothetical protein
MPLLHELKAVRFVPFRFEIITADFVVALFAIAHAQTLSAPPDGFVLRFIAATASKRWYV